MKSPRSVSFFLLFIFSGSVLSKIVFLDNFKHGRPLDPDEPKSQWQYLELPAIGFRADDVFLQQGRGFARAVSYYNKTYLPGKAFGGLNTLNFFVQPRHAPFSVPSDKTFRVEARLSVQSFGTQDHPYGSKAVSNAEDDLRLSASGIMLVNVKYGLTVGLALTNEGIYALQDSLGPMLSSGPATRLWTSAKRVGSRSSASSIHNVTLEYNRKHNNFYWFVDGSRVAKVGKPGKPGFTLLKELVTGVDEGKVSSSELGEWTFFLFNSYASDMGWFNNTDLGLANLEGSGSYVQPTDYAFEPRHNNIRNIIFGAAGCLTMYSVCASMV